MRLKERLVRRQEVSFGAFLGLPSPQLTEMLGLSGYDFAILDTEHGAFGTQSMEECLRAGAAVGLPCLVRVKELSAHLIQTALDLGAEGIQAPRVETADEARTAVAFCRFPPQGVRGYGSTTRAAAYGFKSRPVVLQEASEKLVIVLQIESKKGVENLTEILAVPGVDVVFIGTSDLSLSYGFDRANHPEMTSLVGEIIPRIRRAGKAAGIFIADWHQIAMLKSLGVNYFTSAGTAVIRSALEEQVQSFRSATDSKVHEAGEQA